MRRFLPLLSGHIKGPQGELQPRGLRGREVRAGPFGRCVPDVFACQGHAERSEAHRLFLARAKARCAALRAARALSSSDSTLSLGGRAGI